MSAINDLISQIQDESLRDRIQNEVNKMAKQKKFGLVFEEHLPECTPLYDVPVKRGSLVVLKGGDINNKYIVGSIVNGIAKCMNKVTEEVEEIPVENLVTVAEFGEPIYPYLKPIDSICNAPDSDLWHTLIEADNYHALQLLEYLYAGKVDCIYIDPPYNTGANALENQLDWYKPILEMHKEWQVVNWYVDKGITGTSAEKRPQFMQMIFDAKCGKFDMIITREVSRFARNTVDTLNYTRLLKTHKVDVYFINDNIKTSDGDGEFRLTIMASLSQDESRKTSVRVKAGQQTSMDNGVFYGSGNILGYRRKETIDDNNKKHVDFLVEPEQAETVKMIFCMYLDGHGLMQIKNELERQGRLTAMGKTNWHCTVISHVLKNSFYCGIITYHKEYVPDFLVQKKVKNYGEVELTQVKGRHEPIITVEQYERVQAIMKSKTKEPKITPNGRNCTGKTLPKDIWGRLLVCSCGHGVNRVHWSGSGKTMKIAYRCRSVTQNGTPENRKKKGLPYEGYCNSPMVPRWKLEMMAMYIFREFLNNRDEVLALAKSMLESHIDDVPESDSMTRYALESKQAELDKMQKRIDRLMDMRMDGEITADVFMKQSTETQTKIDSLKDEIEALMPKKEETVMNYSEKLEMLRFALSQYNAPEYFENGIPESVIDAYVEKIVVFEDHFEWYLRFGGNDPLKCRVNGKKDVNPEVIFGDSPSSLTELEKHRLPSANSANKKLTLVA